MYLFQIIADCSMPMPSTIETPAQGWTSTGASITCDVGGRVIDAEDRSDFCNFD